MIPNGSKTDAAGGAPGTRAPSNSPAGIGHGNNGLPLMINRFLGVDGRCDKEDNVHDHLLMVIPPPMEAPPASDPSLHINHFGGNLNVFHLPQPGGYDITIRDDRSLNRQGNLAMLGGASAGAARTRVFQQPGFPAPFAHTMGTRNAITERDRGESGRSRADFQFGPVPDGRRSSKSNNPPFGANGKSQGIPVEPESDLSEPDDIMILMSHSVQDED